jgi:hypothetical protein
MSHGRSAFSFGQLCRGGKGVRGDVGQGGGEECGRGVMCRSGWRGEKRGNEEEGGISRLPDFDAPEGCASLSGSGCTYATCAGSRGCRTMENRMREW